MNEPKTFCVVYKTSCGKGGIRVYIGNFFGSTTLKTIDKFLRLARVHCTSEQQNALLRDLEDEKLMRTGIERERIEKCIKRIKSQTWGKTC